MERRKFLKSATIGSACALAGTVMTGKVMAAQNHVNHKCKITVIKRTLNKEWGKEYRNMEGTLCDKFTDGQEFIIENPWQVPEGFCSWAWADIRTFIHLVNEGRFDTFVSCCTDGFRPVFFKIERTDA